MPSENPPILAEPQPASRKPRADSQRNRELIVQVAKDAFTEKGAGTSLDDIAKKAGVGAGTLYRHFPTREALLEAVYHTEVEKLVAAAEAFGRDMSPIEALKTWLLLFSDYLATKKIIAAALNDLMGTSALFDESKPRTHDALLSLFQRAIDSGDIRPDINPLDILRAIVGVTYFGASDDAKGSAASLVDILILGSRPSA